jgi:hypothetical protein
MPDEFAATGTTTGTSVPSGDGSRPDTPHPAYERMKLRWDKCRMLMGGTPAVRDAGEDALPMMEAETDDSYTFRSQLVALYNGFKRTVLAMVGMILQQEPVLGDDMPEPLVALWENVDQAGTHGAVFTRQLTLDGMVDGHAGILVDYSKLPGEEKIDRDTEQRLGLRPYWVRYTAEDIFLALYQAINGVKTLILLVLREVVEESDGRFGIAEVTRYRVYSREGASISWEVWENGEGEIPALKEGPAPMRNVDGIPFAFFIAGEKLSDVETIPPLIDLAYLNLEHHQLKTNIRNLESLAMVPTMVRVGASPDENGDYPAITLGPRATIEAPAIDGVQTPLYWLSPDVDVLAPGTTSLETIKAEMGAAGLAFLAPDTRAVETAEAKRIDSTAQNASLATAARNLQDALETAFDFSAQYMKLDAGSVTVNTDFENTVLDAATMSAYGQLAANGKLSIETLLTMLEKGKRLPDGFDKTEELRRIMTENRDTDPKPEPDPLANA